MRILQVCARIPFPVEDGGSVYVFNTTKHLSIHGHDVHVASFYSELHKQDPAGLEKFCSLYIEKGDFKPYSLPSVILSTMSRTPVSVQHRMSATIMKSILDQVPNHIDLIILEGLHTSAFLPLIRIKYPNAPVVLRHVNVEHELLLQNARNETNVLKKAFLFDQSRLMKRFEVKAMNKVDAITFISDKDAAQLLPHITGSIPHLINPPGANTDRSIDFDERSENTLIAFSNWKWTPNLDGLKWFLEEVWKELIRIKPNINLVLAGNDLPENISERLPENVQYIGFVEDLYEFNKQATIQIVPLKSGSGVKLKVIEGLSLGNPIVSSSYGVDGIEVKEGEHLEIANTPSEFIEKIVSLLNDRNRRRKLSLNSSEFVKSRYSWDHQIDQLNSFLDSIISGSS